MPGKRILAGLLLASTLVLAGAGCGGSSAADKAAAEKVTLKVWRVFDTADTMKETMDAYRALHPNVSFEYRTMRPEEYQDELLKAFAEGTGPDIFSIHNSWVGQYKPLISPLPPSLTIPYTETRGTIKKETVNVLREEPTISVRTLKKDFVDVVASDVVGSYQPNPKAEPEERIFGLPLAVDTLALFYNRDLLNAAGIAEPPATWTTFQKTDVPKLSSVGANDVIIQSGAALGTSRNVERAFDILSLLMMQNGTTMTDDRGVAAFAEKNDARAIPGADAVEFYTDFANPLKEVYSWNAAQPNSFDAFVAGKTAFFLGYSYHIPLIRARAAKLDFGIAPVPQIDGGKVVNFANYWVETVSKSSPHVNWAWDFIQFATSEEQDQSYLTATGKPPARRAMIAAQLEDENLSVFASQLLTAQSWYHGTDASVTETAFLDLIDAVLAGNDVEEAIGTAQQKVNQTL